MSDNTYLLKFLKRLCHYVDDVKIQYPVHYSVGSVCRDQSLPVEREHVRVVSDSVTCRLGMEGMVPSTPISPISRCCPEGGSFIDLC